MISIFDTVLIVESIFSEGETFILNPDGSASFANGGATIDAAGNLFAAGQTTLGLTPPGGVGPDPNGLLVVGNSASSNLAIASFEAPDGSNGFQITLAGFIGTLYPSILAHEPGVTVIPIGVICPTIFYNNGYGTNTSTTMAWDGYSAIQVVGPGSFSNSEITLGNSYGSVAWINNDGSASFANGAAGFDSGGNLTANNFSGGGGGGGGTMYFDGGAINSNGSGDITASALNAGQVNLSGTYAFMLYYFGDTLNWIVGQSEDGTQGWYGSYFIYNVSQGLQTMVVNPNTSYAWFPQGIGVGYGTGYTGFDSSDGILLNGDGSASFADGGLIIDNAGGLHLNNSYTAGAPSATGYLTIYDKTGTAYKLLAATI
jgi:hypothetical protein